jgi:hypothetical protein
MGDPAEVDEMYARAIRRRNGGTPVTREWVEDAAAATIAFVGSPARPGTCGIS